MSNTTAQMQQCCTSLYTHPVARFLLGESLHPGGLGLTRQLGHRLGLGSESRVFDAGSGFGASAIHLAATFGCSVTGMTLEAEGPSGIRTRAEAAGVADRVSVTQGDIVEERGWEARFDACLAECVASILPDKGKGAASFHRLLRPGGRLGLTDVTVSGPLPDRLLGLFGVAGCVGGALSLDGYAAMLSGAGFEIRAKESLPEVASTFLHDLGNKLMIAEISVKLGKIDLPLEMLEEAKSLHREAREMAHTGTLGYGLLIARRPR